MKKILIHYIIIILLLGTLSGCKGISNHETVINADTPKNDITTTNNPAVTNITPTPSHNTTNTTSPKQDKQSNKDIASIIPNVWDILEKVKGEPVIVEGDLNKDGISDIAAIIERTESEKEAPQRSLLIAFGNKDNTYSLSIIADNVILKADEGGVWGDPFDSLYIDRGSVVVNDFGGSVEKWYNKYRFRFQDNDWYLIGVTMGTYFPVKDAIGNDEDDYNLLTGDFISKRTNENGKENNTKGNRGKKQLIKLRNFNTDEI